MNQTKIVLIICNWYKFEQDIFLQQLIQKMNFIVGVTHPLANYGFPVLYLRISKKLKLVLEDLLYYLIKITSYFHGVKIDKENVALEIFSRSDF